MIGALRDGRGLAGGERRVWTPGRASRSRQTDGSRACHCQACHRGTVSPAIASPASMGSVPSSCSEFRLNMYVWRYTREFQHRVLMCVHRNTVPLHRFPLRFRAGAFMSFALRNPLLNSPCANCSPFRTQHVRRPTTRHTTHGTRNSGEAITAIGPHARATTLSPLLHPLPSLGKQHHIALDQGPPAHDVDDGKRPTKGTPHPSGFGFRATRSVQCTSTTRSLSPVPSCPYRVHPGHTGQQKGGPRGSRAQQAPMSSESKTKTKTQPILLLGNDA